MVTTPHHEDMGPCERYALRRACREALCWLGHGKGKSPGDRGAICETLGEAIDLILTALGDRESGE